MSAATTIAYRSSASAVSAATAHGARSVRWGYSGWAQGSQRTEPGQGVQHGRGASVARVGGVDPCTEHRACVSPAATNRGRAGWAGLGAPSMSWFPCSANSCMSVVLTAFDLSIRVSVPTCSRGCGAAGVRTTGHSKRTSSKQLGVPRGGRSFRTGCRTSPSAIAPLGDGQTQCGERYASRQHVPCTGIAVLARRILRNAPVMQTELISSRSLAKAMRSWPRPMVYLPWLTPSYFSARTRTAPRAR